MSRLLNRQTVGVVLVALLVVTAGCSGLTGSNQADTPTDEGGGGEDTATDEEGTATDTAADTTTAPSEEMTMTPPESPTGTPRISVGNYQFSEGESYTYSVSTSGSDSTSELTWDVTDVSGDQVTVEVTSNFGGRSSSTTLEGTQREIFQQAAQSMTAAFFVSLRLSKTVTTGHSLTTGNSWTLRSEDLSYGSRVQWETATVEVTGTDSFSGVQCTRIEVTPDTQEASSFTSCINPDYPFAIAITSETQGRTTTIRLTSSSR